MEDGEEEEEEEEGEGEGEDEGERSRRESQHRTCGWVEKGRANRISALFSFGGEDAWFVEAEGMEEASWVSKVPDWHSAAPALCSNHCAVAACRTLSPHVEIAILKVEGVMFVAVTAARTAEVAGERSRSLKP